MSINVYIPIYVNFLILIFGTLEMAEKIFLIYNRSDSVFYIICGLSVLRNGYYNF